MGTPEFAVPCLEAIHNSDNEIIGVVTAPDKLGGRGMKQVISSPVKKYAETHDLHILQPVNLKSQKFNSQLQKLNPDLIIVVAFRMLPESIWNMPKFGTYNLHASLLPLYRGAAPINHAIMNGDKVTGLTTFKLQQKIDTGAIAFQIEVPIEDSDNAGTLHDKLMNAGPELILKTIVAISDGTIELNEQTDKQASEAPKIFFENCMIDWENDCLKIYNFIRGLSPYPGAWTKMDGKTLKVFQTDYYELNHDLSPGQVYSVSKDEIQICCRNGLIKLMEVQLEGKSKMNVKTFLNGYKILSEKIG